MENNICPICEEHLTADLELKKCKVCFKRVCPECIDNGICTICQELDDLNPSEDDNVDVGKGVKIY